MHNEININNDILSSLGITVSGRFEDDSDLEILVSTSKVYNNGPVSLLVHCISDDDELEKLSTYVRKIRKDVSDELSKVICTRVSSISDLSDLINLTTHGKILQDHDLDTIPREHRVHQTPCVISYFGKEISIDTEGYFVAAQLCLDGSIDLEIGKLAEAPKENGIVTPSVYDEVGWNMLKYSQNIGAVAEKSFMTLVLDSQGNEIIKIK